MGKDLAPPGMSTALFVPSEIPEIWLWDFVFGLLAMAALFFAERLILRIRQYLLAKP